MCAAKWEERVKHFCCIPSMIVLVEKCRILGLNEHFLSWNIFFLERMNNKECFSDWAFGGHFLKHEQRQPVTSRKITHSICCQ
jgi:hypothetical protein